jgi:hypothetical protein
VSHLQLILVLIMAATCEAWIFCCSKHEPSGDILASYRDLGKARHLLLLAMKLDFKRQQHRLPCSTASGSSSLHDHRLLTVEDGIGLRLLILVVVVVLLLH